MRQNVAPQSSIKKPGCKQPGNTEGTEQALRY